ncbi:hypothetical protein FNV43_RR06186 [Rhamnella rubrinervis]|uniref:Uncharacterized protein n=1 Tax=Rhamnella rubrinervis TaxID=2594499 RepID=A0A8K0HCK1_9ROSA|nr:hypothetical protein FNV43_RR06186 [Rhamnella rubrinervis]
MAVSTCSHDSLLPTTTIELGPQIFINNDMSCQKEKQISVDPISLTEKSVDSTIILPPVSAPKPSEALSLSLPPPLLPAKPKFLSCSLPNSANSSPRFGAAALLLKKKWSRHFESQASPRQVNGNGHLQQQELVHFRRSKSCGEGRALAPSNVDFDLWELNNNKPNNASDHHYSMINKSNNNRYIDVSFSKTDHQTKKVVYNNHNNNSISDSDDGFKCGALCLFLPGFGKAKPVRARKEEAVVVENIGISRTVSLEKFECGSWASSAINAEDGDSMNLYFDLPLELMRTGVNDAHSPVSCAFVFDKDRKGVLKNSSTRPSVSAPPRKSHESPRHVRFSVSSSPTSYPASPATCITPRLRKAREDFNAFLEAQSA